MTCKGYFLFQLENDFRSTWPIDNSPLTDANLVNSPSLADKSMSCSESFPIKSTASKG